MARCKFCTYVDKSWRTMKGHIEDTHPEEFILVTTWLHQTVDAKLEAHKTVIYGSPTHIIDNLYAPREKN